ncbi:MAG: HepT-like ribonuclease domain-containing protein [Chloroflexota bacterium]
MWEASRRMSRFVRGVTPEQFAADEMRHSAVERQIIVLGEAARRISSSFKEAYSEIPWGQVIGLRNLVTHEYERVDLNIIWKVATESIPELARLLAPLIPPPPKDEQP